MANHREPNLDGDCASSSLQKTVTLRDWWLIKCSKEFEGKRFGVAGVEIGSETRAMRVFTSSPIIKALDIFTIQTSDGICITLRGFLNKERVVLNGFSPEIYRHFIFGFPPEWKQFCNDFFGGDKSKACFPILSSCKNNKGNTAEISGGYRERDGRTATRKSLRLRSKSGAKSVGVDDERKLELSKVQNKSGEVEKVMSPAGGFGRKHTGADNVDEVINRSAIGESLTSERRKSEVMVRRVSPRSLFKDFDKSSKPGKKEMSKKRKKALKNDGVVVEPVNYSRTKVNVSKLQNPTTGGDHVSEGLNNVKGSEPMNSSKPKKKENSKKSKKTLKSDRNVVETMNHSGSKVKEAEENLTGEKTKRKTGKKGQSKKSKKTLQSDRNVVETMNHSRSKVKEAEENMSVEKIKRKLDFDAEVTPEKTPKEQNTNADSTGSLGQKRSRSGRVLVSTLEFWRNQIPVYDKDRNIVQIKEGHESPLSKGKGSASRKPRR